MNRNAPGRRPADYLSISEAARVLDTTLAQVKTMMAAGLLPCRAWRSSTYVLASECTWQAIAQMDAQARVEDRERRERLLSLLNETADAVAYERALSRLQSQVRLPQGRAFRRRTLEDTLRVVGRTLEPLTQARMMGEVYLRVDYRRMGALALADSLPVQSETNRVKHVPLTGMDCGELLAQAPEIAEALRNADLWQLHAACETPTRWTLADRDWYVRWLASNRDALRQSVSAVVRHTLATAQHDAYGRRLFIDEGKLRAYTEVVRYWRREPLTDEQIEARVAEAKRTGAATPYQAPYRRRRRQKAHPRPEA